MKKSRVTLKIQYNFLTLSSLTVQNFEPCDHLRYQVVRGSTEKEVYIFVI